MHERLLTLAVNITAHIYKYMCAVAEWTGAITASLHLLMRACMWLIFFACTCVRALLTMQENRGGSSLRVSLGSGH
jgi:hypothetical protein